MYYKRSRSDVKGQGHSMKAFVWSPNYCSFFEIGVAESNRDVRIFWSKAHS